MKYVIKLNVFAKQCLQLKYTTLHRTEVGDSKGLTPLGLPSLCLLHLPSRGLLVILPLTPFGLLLVYTISLSMASWILGYGFMITCSVMPIWPLNEFI